MARQSEGWSIGNKPDARTGHWICQFRIAGRKIRRSTGCASKAEAKAIAAEIYAAALREAECPGYTADPLLADLFYRYLDAVRDAISPEYWRVQHLRSVKISERFPRLSDLTDASLRQYHKERLQEVTRTSVSRDMVALRQCLKWARSEGLIDRHIEILMPHKSAAGTRRNDHRRADLTPAQVETLIAALPECTRFGNPLRDVFAFSWDTGLRAGAIWRLEAGAHFRRGRDYLTLTPDIVKTREALSIPLTARAYAILDRHAPDIGPIFKQWDYRTAVNNKARELGLDTDGKVHLRAVRHAAITDAQRMAEGDRMAVKAMAGHRNISTTDRYTHSNLDDARRALNARFPQYGTPNGTPTGK